MDINQKVKINKEWLSILKPFFESESWNSISKEIKKEYLDKTIKIFPEAKDIFKAFDLTPFSKVKVVILGQDPYHDDGQANGLCFSVNKKIPLPPSLKNIYKEIEDDLKIKKDFTDGDLTVWAKQGVFLLNSILTVTAHNPASHRDKGWEKFTDNVIKTLNNEKEGLVFILWGNYARSKNILIDKEKHLIIESVHPSPFSVYNGFFGSKPFSKCNNYLKKRGLEEIKW